ncbi:hypothetical protein SEPCBS119000_002422 [Sporothrix epigloea]|uniref:DUF7165 domain-containing protein n=1 Tax=Sporothrix epigloea TaxID=1892477 RepID=A0ABP0DJC2_9PEZI
MADGDEAPEAPAPLPLLPSTDNPDPRDRLDKHGDVNAIKKTVKIDSEEILKATSRLPDGVDHRCIANAPPAASAFERLPDAIIQKILLSAGPGTFASLVLLHPRWRAVSQQAHIYAHHLSRSPTHITSNDKILIARLKELQNVQQNGNPDFSRLHDRLLCELRRAFARKVKRCLFDAYLRPSRTLISIVSNTISSSSAPGGEDLQFQASPRGHHLLAYNSSRIYILDVRHDKAPHGVELVRELKVLRRPVAICIRDDALVLAVLLTEMQVDLYDLQERPPRHTQTIVFGECPRAIALSPCGSVLAVAYKGGIEVLALGSRASPAGRRAVKCDSLDTLAFSYDGTQILGTSVHGAHPNTVVLTAPYYDPGSQISSSDLGALWTTSILFPNTSRDCSHAVLLRDPSCEEASWAFAYDRSFETFRAVRIEDLRNGTTYFTGPIPTISSPGSLLPSTLPSASYDGSLVAAGFSGREIWLYGLPEDQDNISASSSSHCDGKRMDPGAPGGFEGMGSTLVGNSTSHVNDDGVGSDNLISNTTNASIDATLRTNGVNSRTISRSTSMRATFARLQDSGSDYAGRVPQWELLRDRQRNTFIDGVCVGELPGVDMVSWVEGYGASSLCKRLLVGARRLKRPPLDASEADNVDFADGGRLLVMDFDYATSNGKTAEVTIEVGSNEPELLAEAHRDIDAEVDIVRRRTVAQRRTESGTAALLRSATTAGLLGPYNARILSVMQPAASTATTVPSGRLRPQIIRPVRVNSGAPASGDAALVRSQNEADLPISCRQVSEAAGDAHSLVNGDTTTAPPLQDWTGTQSTLDVEEREAAEAALDAPYSHDGPRSSMTLQRAATAAATNRRLRPPAATTADGQPVAHRRADGRREHPHESDADNWVPPPPPYQKDADLQDLPAFLRHNVPPVTAPVTTARTTTASTATPQISTVVPPPPPPLPAALPSATNTRSGSRPPGNFGETLPNSRLVSHRQGAGDLLSSDLYDASPAGSPPPAAAEVPQHRPQQLLSHQDPSDSNFVPRPVASVQTWPSQWPFVSSASRAGTSVDVHLAPDQRISSAARPNRRLASYPTATSTITIPIANHPGQDELSQDRMAGDQHALPPSSLNRQSLGSFRVPRVPVGSNRRSRALLNGRPSTASVLPASRNENKPPLCPHEAAVSHQVQPQLPAASPEPATSNHSVASRLVEDQPLIISTPGGLSGAFDDSPKRGKSDQQHREESENGLGPVIFAPVPRHPQAQERSAELRERLETLSDGRIPAAPVQKPLILPFSAQLAESHESLGSCTTGTSGAVHHSSPNRRQRRTERSTAKLMLETKRRGWRRRNSKGEKREIDSASSAGAHTAIKAASPGGSCQQPSTREQELLPQLQEAQATEKKSAKCLIM